MNEHYLHAERARERQQEARDLAATERSLRALRHDQQVEREPDDRPSSGPGLLTALVAYLRRARARPAPR